MSCEENILIIIFVSCKKPVIWSKLSFMCYFRVLLCTEVEALVIQVTVAHRVLFLQPVLQA